MINTVKRDGKIVRLERCSYCNGGHTYTGQHWYSTGTKKVCKECGGTGQQVAMRLLLPCPFCEGHAEVIEMADCSCIVECQGCFSRTGPEPCELDAVTRWNDRHP